MDPAKAKWSFDVCGKEVRVSQSLVRIGFLDGEGFQFLDEPNLGIEEVRKFRPKVDLFTFIQRLSDTNPAYDYPMEWDNFAAVRVTAFDEWMGHQINAKTRNMIRKATKSGVVVREIPFDDALIHGISEIYNESPMRQGRQFPHYKIDFDALRKMKATFLERSIFIGAFYDSDLIGFIKLVMNENHTQAGLMHILSTIKDRDKAPTNALIAQAVKSCAERGIPYLWYANMSYGNKQNDTLAEFKKHNGFQKIDVPRYYVPLTLRGRLALQLKLHHGIQNWVPEPIAAQLRRVRSLWYAKRVPGLQNA